MKVWKTSDFSRSLAMKTFLEQSSVNVMKYLYPWWEAVGSFPQMSKNICPKISSDHMSVIFWISVQACLPLRQALQTLGLVGLPQISIPLTMPFHAICRMALECRCPSLWCLVPSVALEPVDIVVVLPQSGQP